MNVVSLVGRPNTGKSALFNRIAKKRIAIVFDQPGVTATTCPIRIQNADFHFAP